MCARSWYYPPLRNPCNKNIPLLKHVQFRNKKILGKVKYFTKDEYFLLHKSVNLSSHIRGATLIYEKIVLLCGILTYPRQLTYALTSWNTKVLKHLRCTHFSYREIVKTYLSYSSKNLKSLKIPFDHALSSPFNNLLFYPALSTPESLYSAYTVFISASTVYDLFSFYYNIL